MKIDDQFACALITAIRVAIDRPHDHAFERLREVAIDLACRRGRFVDVRKHGRDQVVAILAERQRPRKKLVHDDADRVEIGAFVFRA